MNRFLIAATLFLAFGWNAFAQRTADAPASKEDVERYFDAMHSRDMVNQVAEAMAKPMHQMIHEQSAKCQSGLPTDFETRMNKIVDSMWKDMPFDEMLQAMVPAYQKHFTKGDMDALVAFYSTPTGQKLLREMPAVMGEAMETMMPIMRRRVDAMTQRVQEEVSAAMRDSAGKPGQCPPATQN